MTIADNPTVVAASTGSPAPRVRVAIEYAVQGDLRFTSHRDEMRVLGRALVRAAWPLRYSRGFNPAPHLSIALPRSTGMASECQVALIDVSDLLNDGAGLVERLARTMPAAMPLHRLIADGVPRSLHPKLVTYECALPPDAAESLAVRLEAGANGPILVERERDARGHTSPVDVRPFVDGLDLSEGRLRMRLRFEGERSARPIDILRAFDLDAEECGHRLRRVEVTWNQAPEGREFRPARASEHAAPDGVALTECAAQARAGLLASAACQPAAIEKRNTVGQEEANLESPGQEGDEPNNRNRSTGR